ncbi:IclR family transcriptional regulator [Planomonospora parontospora]|uniref:IclR family transcriptional regulator n=1 Tax=Planomonospora parontospora TaxID=58119 RepID=UPI001670020D|nr:helix-turn-helix domain-containing protein [Planomonospora parontospora]GGL54727.1 transcriptional regulator [Planomonospora parontospora subsp. antibiotica]GII19754.1 transcriptional regulator [Planomonospora parontospora subsp. antibiotica]
MAAESSQTLERGLRLLRLLSGELRGRTPTEIAAELELSRPAVYRLLTTLQREGFVRRDGDGRVHLGFGVLVLARAVQPLLREGALPTLRRLAEEVGATAHLTVAEGDEGLAVAVVEPSWTDMHVAYREGSRHPLDRGAAGRAVLALRAGRGGYVATEGQLQEGARGIAAPVPGLPWLEASVGVIAFTPLDPGTVGPRVATAAADLARALG